MANKTRTEWQMLTDPTDEYVNARLAEGWRLWSSLPVVTKVENWIHIGRNQSVRGNDTVVTTWHIKLFREISDGE